MTYPNLSDIAHDGKSTPDDMSTPVDDWQHIGTIADRLILAWDKVEAREEAGNLAAWTTERQRALIFQEMWYRASHKWQCWALEWVASNEAKRGVARHRKVAAEAGVMQMSDAFDVPIKRVATKAVWLALVYRANDRNECWPSLDRIARDVSADRSTVCRALDELEAMGLIFRSRSEGRHVSRYGINCRRAQQLTVAQCDTKERRKKGDDVDVEMSATQREVREVNKSLKLQRRRTQVRDAYLAACAILGPGQYVTIPALAHDLGMPAAQVRSALSAVFKTINEVPIELQMRLRRAQRKPWNWGLEKGRANVVPFHEHRRAGE